MASGEMSTADYVRFLSITLNAAASVSREGALHYVCTDWRHIAELLAAAKAVYGDILNLAVWVKSNAGQGSFYRSQHELVGVFRVGEEAHLNNVELGRHGRSRFERLALRGSLAGLRRGIEDRAPDSRYHCAAMSDLGTYKVESPASAHISLRGTGYRAALACDFVEGQAGLSVNGVLAREGLPALEGGGGNRAGAGVATQPRNRS